MLQPKFHYRYIEENVLYHFFLLLMSSWFGFIYDASDLSCSCLKVVLEILEKLQKPDVNALLHEFGFQVSFV